MKAPQIGRTVRILESPKGKPRDGIVWTIWSQSPTGWHLFHRDSSDKIQWADVPARLMTPARETSKA